MFQEFRPPQFEYGNTYHLGGVIKSIDLIRTKKGKPFFCGSHR